MISPGAIWQRWVQFAVGIVMLSLGVAVMVQAHVGLGPWDVLHQGVSTLVGIPIGMASIVVGLGIMLLWIPLGERPALGTLLNIIFIGVLVDTFMLLVPSVDSSNLLPAVMMLPAQLGQMVLGVIVMGVGVGLYLSAGVGAGPRDGVMMGLVRHTGLSVRVIRTFMELIALGVGWLLGGTVGLGTLIFAFGIGPVVQSTLSIVGRWWQTHGAASTG